MNGVTGKLLTKAHHKCLFVNFKKIFYRSKHLQSSDMGVPANDFIRNAAKLWRLCHNCTNAICKNNNNKKALINI